jgi:hypothetical protein
MRFGLFLAVFLSIGLAACGEAEGDRPRASYDPKTGRLTTLVYDANKNGKNDAVSFMDGTRILRVELDWDENGKVERWDIYKPDRTLEKVGMSRKNDGVMDAQAFYTGDGALQRIEVSTRRDGTFDRVEYYERDAEARDVMVRTTDDTDRDGRADKWDTYTRVANPPPGAPPYSITSSAFDDEGSGKPTRRLVFAADGAVAHVEIDPDGDGVFVPLGSQQAAATSGAAGEQR